MQITAESKYVRMSPRKVRLVAHAVRRLSLDRAMTFLESVDKKAADPIRQTITSAIANAKNNHTQVQKSLYIESIMINEGPVFKRWRAVSRGMAHGYKKRTSHITVILGVKKSKIQKQTKDTEKTKDTDMEKAEKKTEKVTTDSAKITAEEIVTKPEQSVKPKVEKSKPGRLAGLTSRFMKKTSNRTTNK